MSTCRVLARGAPPRTITQAPCSPRRKVRAPARLPLQVGVSMARLAARSREFAASSHLVVHVVRLRVAIQAVEAILGDLLLAHLLMPFGSLDLDLG